MIYEFLSCFYQSTKLFSNFHKISFLSSQLFSFTHHRFMVYLFMGYYKNTHGKTRTSYFVIGRFHFLT